MKIILVLLISVLTVILIYRISRDIFNRRYIDSRWPSGFSRKIKAELWELQTCGPGELFRIKDATLFLNDYVDFFRRGFRIPFGCSEDNPLVMVDDMDKPDGNQKVMTRSEFDIRYSNYKPFNSYREYDKYLRSLDFPT